MRSGQSKTRYAVIERGSIPTLRGVASGTVCGAKCRSRRRVHRIIGLLPIVQMTLRIPAIGWRDGQGIIIVDVAEIAGHGCMAIG
jgi:hypothetical protein